MSRGRKRTVFYEPVEIKPKEVKFKQALNKEDWTQKLSYAKRVYGVIVDETSMKGKQSFSYTNKSGQPYIVYYELKN